MHNCSVGTCFEPVKFEHATFIGDITFIAYTCANHFDEYINATHRLQQLWKEDIKQYCGCGCGNEIVQKSKWQPIRYLPGHNNKPVMKNE